MSIYLITSLLGKLTCLLAAVSAHHGQDLGAAVGEREQFYSWRERFCSNWRRRARRVALASAR